MTAKVHIGWSAHFHRFVGVYPDHFSVCRSQAQQSLLGGTLWIHGGLTKSLSLDAMVKTHGATWRPTLQESEEESGGNNNGAEDHPVPHLRFNIELDVDTCRQSNHRARKKNRVLSAMSARNGVSTSNCFSTLDDQMDDDTDECNNHTDITKASYTIVLSIFGRLDAPCPP